ncbi:hypothetical protein AC578_3123 [Pseudocercospora eumusae]|uniref:Galactose oxidase n=1 Tax=Pseudocercospora eumusae TaxID=321146 RepID=A0A139H6A8_9PEZI|nr:hypothetical protein AC578_3123 [Pseudocercospora eumusae]
MHEASYILSLFLYSQWSALSFARPNTPEWNRMPSIGQGTRQEHAAVATDNDKIWILGGTVQDRKAQFQTTDRVEVFSLSLGKWQVAPPLPEPLNHANAASVNNTVYLLGGLSAGDDWLARNITAMYDSATRQWKTRAPMPIGTARGACAVGVHGNTIYLAGGMTYLNLTQDGAQDCLTTVTAYDTSTDRWTRLPDLPAPRQHVGGAVVGDTFYVLGGRTTGQLEIQDSLYALDLRDPKAEWKVLPSMPTARGGLACAAVRRSIYCMGGEGNTNSPQGIFSEVEAFDTRTNMWTKLQEMPTPRHGWGVAAVNDTIYSPGGGLKAGTMPTDVFDSYTVV